MDSNSPPRHVVSQRASVPPPPSPYRAVNHSGSSGNISGDAAISGSNRDSHGGRATQPAACLADVNNPLGSSVSEHQLLTRLLEIAAKLEIDENAEVRASFP
eukprot:CAMPEP_0176465000 /NCGR_PEP_ID=MMETSP0127-20121128/36926_1 /TAXON_ID=938130 /ORGANISM="Platyophrya macrostoma, Strain WH" /LENGTH=101 /DNA_ID=CAMNT_0017857673 /DNA_START=171 /DNA_END=473 /DNA_ORIENTATION=-